MIAFLEAGSLYAAREYIIAEATAAVLPLLGAEVALVLQIISILCDGNKDSVYG